DTRHLVLTWQGETVADIPLDPLAEKAPSYDRPALDPDAYRAWAGVKPLTDVPESTDLAADLLKLMACPDIASKRWIWEQYDHMVGADTVQRPGGDAAVVRVHGTRKALALTTDCTPRYCYADPREGGRQAVAEAWRNLIAVGAKPLAITDCLNFGNPQRPEIMAQLVGCIEGMAEACRALDFPVVSGNVSLYNETDGTGILPTPAVGAVGLIEDYARTMTMGFKAEGEQVVLIAGSREHLGQSLWLREVGGREEGSPPPVDLDHERRAGAFVASLIAEGIVSAVHDCADGGLAVAIAEMALASDIGFYGPHLTNGGVGDIGRLFGEDQGRYVVTTSDQTQVIARGMAAGIFALPIGTTGGDALIFGGSTPRKSAGPSPKWCIPLAALGAAHEGALPALMATAA
ncbi:MAG: phosphoribosylformylglycinamidine synthase II, partial [Sphingomonadaceae bacterium]|nr:phosphoribosylformylglycinamidine synthase II [Sphingomonadaceae bacterium]